MRAFDFVEEVMEANNTFVPPVQSLMDVDFYKFTMGQFIHKNYPDTVVTFKLIVRDPTIPIATIVDEQILRKSLDHVRSLRFRKTDLYYLRGQDLYETYLFKEPYLDFLRTYQLPPYKLSKGDGGYELTFTGRWCEVSPWETIALAIMSALYYRAVLKNKSRHELEKIYVRAMDRLFLKLERIQGYPRIRFADFAQRRRHSFSWQKWVVQQCKAMLGEQFTGTSNTWLAFNQDFNAIGTNAHELPMVATALGNSDDEMRYAQYRVCEQWEEMYGQGLRIMLPDTYGSAQFFANAPKFLENWKGERQDSGKPIIEGERYMQWLASRGIDPKSRLTIFSDGLDVGPMFKIDDHFANRHPHLYGWGTLLANDFEGCDPGNTLLRPISMVCKVVEADGRPCVKLPNNIQKATGLSEAVARYLRLFGSEGQTSEKVRV